MVSVAGEPEVFQALPINSIAGENCNCTLAVDAVLFCNKKAVVVPMPMLLVFLMSIL
jgi:hypothetical protein